MNSETIFVLMDMNATAPIFWREFCHSTLEVFTLTVAMLYPVGNIQFDKLQKALINGI